MIYNKYMENKEKKYKVCWIIALIVTIIASVGFIISTLFLVSFMSEIIVVKNGGNAGNGIGAAMLAVLSLISSAISSGISVLGIIFSCIGKKYKAKSGKVMLILNIIYPIIYILLFVISLIINS